MKGLRQLYHLSSKWSIWGGGAKVHGGMICVQNRGKKQTTPNFSWTKRVS